MGTNTDSLLGQQNCQGQFCGLTEAYEHKTPKPKLVLHMERGKTLNPRNLKQTPDWAKPIVAATLKLRLS
jgi:hypothetical protein